MSYYIFYFLFFSSWTQDKGEEAYLETYDIGSEDGYDQNMELRPV